MCRFSMIFLSHFTNPSLTLGASRFPLGFPTDFDFQVHAYNEDSLLRNEVTDFDESFRNGPIRRHQCPIQSGATTILTSKPHIISTACSTVSFFFHRPIVLKNYVVLFTTINLASLSQKFLDNFTR